MRERKVWRAQRMRGRQFSGAMPCNGGYVRRLNRVALKASRTRAIPGCVLGKFVCCRSLGKVSEEANDKEKDSCGWMRSGKRAKNTRRNWPSCATGASMQYQPILNSGGRVIFMANSRRVHSSTNLRFRMPSGMRSRMRGGFFLNPMGGGLAPMVTDWPGKFAPIMAFAGNVRICRARESFICWWKAKRRNRCGIRSDLKKAGANVDNVKFFKVPTDRGWMLDSGPIAGPTARGKLH